MNASEKYHFLSLTKFISSLLICVALHYSDHFVPSFGKESFLYNIKFVSFFAKESALFVELFFIMSGLLFFHTAFVPMRRGEISFDGFLIKRLRRLCPLAAITTIYFYLAECILYARTGTVWDFCGSVNIIDLILNLLFLGETIFGLPMYLNGPIWYLNVLLFCYTVGFFLLKIYCRTGEKTVFMVPIFIGILIQVQGINWYLLNFSVSRGLVAFFIGCYLEMLFASYYHKKAWRKILCGGVICLMVMLTVTAFFWEQIIGNKYIFVDFMIFPELLIVLSGFEFYCRLCRSKAAEYLGRISYDMYLWNMPIFLTLYCLMVFTGWKVEVNGKMFWAIVVGLNLIVATISDKIQMRIKNAVKI